MKRYHRYAIGGIIIVAIGLVVIGIYSTFRKKNADYSREMSMRDTSRVDLMKVWNSLNSTKYCVKNKTYALDNGTLCLWGYPNPLPRSGGEIVGASYNGGSVIMKSHPLRLNIPQDYTLSMRRDWWRLPNTHSIVSGYNPGEYLMLNDKGLWYSTEGDLQHLTTEQFELLFKYKNTPYGLVNGQIRKGLSKIEHERNNRVIYNGDDPYWNWESVRVLADTDLTDMYIIDVSVAENGEILLVDDRYNTHLINSYNDIDIELESEEYISNTRVIDAGSRKWYHLPVWKIRLGQSSKHFLIFYSHDVALVENDIILYTVSNIRDAIIHPHDKYSILTVDKYGHIAMYRYGDGKVIDLDSSNRRRQSIDGRASSIQTMVDTGEVFIISPENMTLRL